MPPLVIVSYSHRDERWKDKVVEHLRVVAPQGEFVEWDDRQIEAGATWRQDIDDALSRADLAVLLISRHFFSSSFIQDVEIPGILQRRETADLRVVPIIAEACGWQRVAWISKIQARPTDGKALLSMPRARQEEALAAIALEIADLLRPRASVAGEAESANPVPLHGLQLAPEAPTAAQAAATEAVATEPQNSIRRSEAEAYEHVEGQWLRCAEHYPIDVERLARKSAGMLDGTGGYPWRPLALAEAGLDDRAVRRLCKCGLLRVKADHGTVELVESRLLSWAVATGILAAWRGGEMDADSLVQRGMACLGPPLAGQPWLGHAALDLLWQLCGDGGSTEGAAALLSALEADYQGENVVRASWELGPRVLPAVLGRFDAIAATESSLSFLYLDLLRRLSHGPARHEIARGAVRYLSSEDASMQSAGISILVFAPMGTALDRLWELRCRKEPQRSLPAQAELADALAACAPENPGWVESRLLASDPACEPVGDLVYLLLHIEGGKAMWQRLRDGVILPKASGPGDRPIAYCVYQFGDTSMIGWLRDRIDRKDDVVGPAALRALLFLDPEADPPATAGEALDLLLSFRGWWFLSYLVGAEARAREWAVGLLRSHPNPWWVAMVYGHLETWIPEAAIEVLLDLLEQLLVGETANPTDGGAVRRPLGILAAVHRRDLLRCFERRRGGPLEEHLTGFLMRLGPNDTGWVRHVDDDAYAVLWKIAGQGCKRVAAFFLQNAQTPLGQRTAIELAVRGVTEEGLDVLAGWVGIADGQAPPQQDREELYARSQALRVLAMAGRFRAVVEGVVRFGRMVPRDLPDYLGGAQFSDAELAPALSRLSGSQTPAGALLAVGFGRRADLAPRVRAILEEPGLSTDLLIAGLLALNLLRDDSPAAEAILRAHLPNPETRYAAAWALQRFVDRRSVRRALLDEVGRLGEETPTTSMDALPGDLLVNPATRADAARVLWDRYRKDRRLFFAGDIVGRFAVLGEEAQSLLREVAAGEVPRPHSASRSSAIQGLAELDRAAAFAAAAEWLADTSAQDRAETPRLLLSIDAERALPILREALGTDEDFVVLQAIGEAVDRAAEGSVSALLDEWLQASSVAVRLGACAATEASSWTAERERLILALLRDDDWDVRNAAGEALEPIRRSRELRAVVEDLEDPDCRDDWRWTLLDAALALGHPGIVFDRPQWFERVRLRLRYPARRYVSEKIAEKRKSLGEELGRRKRPGT